MLSLFLCKNKTSKKAPEGASAFPLFARITLAHQQVILLVEVAVHIPMKVKELQINELIICVVISIFFMRHSPLFVERKIVVPLSAALITRHIIIRIVAPLPIDTVLCVFR